MFIFKLPDLGEGTVEAELVVWRVRPGDVVQEDQVIAEVMTDKASVEIPAPVSGRVVALCGEPGDRLAVGSELIRFETSSSAPSVAVSPGQPPDYIAHSKQVSSNPPHSDSDPHQPILKTMRVMASPATRRRAAEAGIDLMTISGSGPGGRILPGDVDTSPRDLETEEIRVLGLRRVIAQRMSEAKRSIPHFAYIEEVDVSELEFLRGFLNQDRGSDESLTYLPFIILGLARALRKFPQFNAIYDAQKEVMVRHRSIHVGIATQTPDGLVVPVLRSVESLSLEQIAIETRRLVSAARARKSSREELSGSTITVTSLGRLGGIASTPVINAPELAIIGVNKAIDRPTVRDGAIVVRRLMNLSSSFDHRFIDGADAAQMIQCLRGFLEYPATLFI